MTDQVAKNIKRAIEAGATIAEVIRDLTTSAKFYHRCSADPDFARAVGYAGPANLASTLENAFRKRTGVSVPREARPTFLAIAKLRHATDVKRGRKALVQRKPAGPEVPKNPDWKPRQKIADPHLIVRWHKAGRSYQWIAEALAKRHGRSEPYKKNAITNIYLRAVKRDRLQANGDSNDR